MGQSFTDAFLVCVAIKILRLMFYIDIFLRIFSGSHTYRLLLIASFSITIILETILLPWITITCHALFSG